DNNDCTDDICKNGVASHTNTASGTACGMNGSLVCDGNGTCVGCVLATDCAGQDTDCKVRTCTGNVCGLANEPKGKPTSTQRAGDCQVNQCAGNGRTETAPDNADVPVDNKTCTQDLCSNGMPSNPPEPVGTMCSEGSGTLCDGMGACVACLTVS